MATKTKQKTLVILLFVILTSVSALAQQPAQQLITLHKETGTIIDDEINRRFHLFTIVPGFVSAKVYQKSQSDWAVHIKGVTSGYSWLIIRQLTQNQKNVIHSRIAAVLRSPDTNPPSKPVISLSVPEQSVMDRPLLVRLTDNSRLYGYFTLVSPEAVQFITISKLQMTIPDDIISDVQWPKGEVVGDVFKRYDPNNNRLLFGPTGRTLKAGQGDFTDFYVVFPTIAYGFTDFLMIGGGVSIIPGASSQLVYIAPKIGLIQQEKLNLAAGFLYMNVPEEDNFGAVYSSLTIGNPLGGVTLGTAVPVNTNESDFNSPAFLLGAETQISNSVKLLTENWVFTGDDSFVLFSGGVRFFSDKLSADIGLFTSPDFFDEGGFPFIPWLDFSISFGR